MSVAGTVWMPVGPSPILLGPGASRNDNGTVTCVVVHPANPNIIYRGTNSGGIWKTTDGGARWVPIFDQEDGRGVGEAGGIALDPNDLSTIYVGISDNIFTRSFNRPFVDSIQRRGLYRSTDGGASWVLLGSGFPAWNVGNGSLFAARTITQIIVDPADSNVIFVATDNGVYRSTDGGFSWGITAGLNGLVDSLELDRTTPSNARVLFAGVYGDGVYRWTVGGAAGWQRVHQVPSASSQVVVCLAPATSPPAAAGIQVAYCCTGSGGTNDTVALWMTTDGGTTWSSRPATGAPGGTAAGYSLAMGIDPSSPGDGVGDTVLIGAVFQAVSYDAGASFTAISGVHADTHAWAFSPLSGGTSVAYCGTDGGLMKSVDAARAVWSPLNDGGVQTALYYNLAGRPGLSSTEALGGLQDNGIVRMSGGSWTQTLGNDGWTAVYDGATPGRAYCSINTSATAVGVFRSDDDGASWTNKTPWSGAQDAGIYLVGLAADPSNANVVYACGNQNLWQSRDGGDSWQQVSNAPSLATRSGEVAVAPSDGNYVAVAIRNRVWVSTNALSPVGGTNPVAFTEISQLPVGRSITRVAFDPNDPTRLYVTVGGYAGSGNAGHVFRTTLAAGQPWVDISPAARLDDVLTAVDVPFGALALDGSESPSAIYVGCDLGVLRSVNDGRTWSVVDDVHLPRVPVTDLSIDGGDRVLRVATYGRGVFQFTNPDWPSIAVNLEDQLDFGVVCPGGDHRRLDVFNVGSSPLRIESVSLLMGSTNFVVEGQPATPVVIETGEHLEFTVTYRPSAADVADQAIIRISSNDPHARFLDVVATAYAGAPQLDIIAPPRGMLGSTCLGEMLDAELTLTNSGTCPLTIRGARSLGPAFTVGGVNRFPITIGPGDSTEIPVRFTPEHTGADTAVVEFASDDPRGIVGIRLTAQCLQPRLVAMVADSASFGPVCVGAFTDVDLTIANSGECSLVIDSITSSDTDFVVPSVFVEPIVVAPGTNLRVPIRFQPTSFGAKTAVIELVSNDAASPTRIQVSGFAPHGTLAITGSACFGEVLFGHRVQQRLTLSNVGECALHVTEVDFSGCRCPGCSTLKLVRNPFPATLRPGAALDLVLQYTATGGSACCRTLVVRSDDPSQPEVTIEVSAMTKPTLSSALKGWLGHSLQSLLATQLDRPCDEGTYGAHDETCC